MWYTENTDRWDLEQSALTSLGILYQIDEEFMAQGFLRLKLEISDNSIISDIPQHFLPIKLTAIFPSTYPFFRPIVYAEEINLKRHQNIISKNLCLIPRSSSYWLPETTLAEHLKEQLPKVLIHGMITDPKLLVEDLTEQAEPISEYYQVEANASVILDTKTFDEINTVNDSINFLGYTKFGLPSDAEVPSRVMALEYLDKNGRLLGKLPDIPENIFKYRQTASIYRVSEAPPSGNPYEDYKWLNNLLDLKREKIKKFNVPITLKNGNSISNIIGITFPEEHTLGQFSWGWLFLVSGTFASVKTKGIKTASRSYKYYAKVNRINANELSFRIPSLKPLAEKNIAVFGLGALGAPSVIEFAKNGIDQIRIIDFDIVNAGTTVRWPLGISAAGMYKTDALERFLKENYPYVDIKKYRYAVGGSLGNVNITPEILSKIASMEEILSDVSMIYDATAEMGVSHFLSTEARKRKIPFLNIYGTQGVWGGAIMRSIPNNTDGCWMCFQYGLSDGTYPTPPADDNGKIQAAGCGDISFTGTSFELGNIVNAGVRLAISTLCMNTDGYRNIESDIGILSLVDENKVPIFPKWTSYKLIKHPGCPYCNK